MGDEVIFHRDGRAEAARSQQIVAAAVTRAALLRRLLLGLSGLLAQSVERVVLGEKAHLHTAPSHGIRRGKGRGDVGDVGPYLKALVLERLAQRRGGAHLAVGKLRIAPYLGGERPCFLLGRTDESGYLFKLCHDTSSL